MIVVFGGAFNPPTLAHKEIYEFILKQVNVDKFIFLPVSNKYSKSTLIDNHHRLKMLQLLVKKLPMAEVSTIEMDDQAFLGTYQSLIKIKEAYPNQKVAFVLGADNLTKLDRWINAEKLLEEFIIIVLNRGAANLEYLIHAKPLLNRYHEQFIVLNHFHSNISSTLFRETMDPEYVDDEIYHYIMKNNLYAGGVK
jgi:nicotinate-nucleotide adenylyltransferase